MGSGISAGLKTAYVAVDDEPADLRLELSYDGESRTVDLNGGRGEPGRFAALEVKEPADQRRDCGRADWPKQFAPEGSQTASCQLVRVQRVPYVAGLGWAPEGDAWLVVTQSADLPQGVTWRSRDGRRSVSYRVDKADRTPRFAFDGYTAPVTVVDLRDGASSGDAFASGPTQAIFAVDDAGGAKELSVTHDLELEPASSSSDSPDVPAVPVSWHVTVS